MAQPEKERQSISKQDEAPVEISQPTTTFTPVLEGSVSRSAGKAFTFNPQVSAFSLSKRIGYGECGYNPLWQYGQFIPPAKTHQETPSISYRQHIPKAGCHQDTLLSTDNPRNNHFSYGQSSASVFGIQNQSAIGQIGLQSQDGFAQFKMPYYSQDPNHSGAYGAVPVPTPPTYDWTGRTYRPLPVRRYPGMPIPEIRVQRENEVASQPTEGPAYPSPSTSPTPSSEATVVEPSPHNSPVAGEDPASGEDPDVPKVHEIPEGERKFNWADDSDSDGPATNTGVSQTSMPVQSDEFQGMAIPEQGATPTNAHLGIAVTDTEVVMVATSPIEIAPPLYEQTAGSTLDMPCPTPAPKSAGDLLGSADCGEHMDSQVVVAAVTQEIGSEDAQEELDVSAAPLYPIAEQANKAEAQKAVERKDSEWLVVGKKKKHRAISPGGNKSSSSASPGAPKKPSSWAKVVSSASPSRPLTPAQGQRSGSPVSPPKDERLAIAAIKIDGKRKLYIPEIPQGTSYEEILQNMRGGLVDDAYVSGLSPDQHMHTQLKGRGHPDSGTGNWFGYVTFFSEASTMRCIEHLNNIDHKLHRTKLITDRRSSYQPPGVPVAYITLKEQRLPVYIRERDQRPLQDDTMQTVTRHNGTRVLLFTFRKSLRTKSPHAGNTVVWETWQRSFSRGDGKEGLKMIAKAIQIWKRAPEVYSEKIELLPVETTSSSPKLPSRVPKTYLGASDRDTFRVRVSLLRISVAQRVMQCLQSDMQFRDHCIIAFDHDHCAGPIQEIEEFPENAADVAAVMPNSKKAQRKKKESSSLANIMAPATDNEAFPPLPGAARSRDGENKPTGKSGWCNKDCLVSTALENTDVSINGDREADNTTHENIVDGNAASAEVVHVEQSTDPSDFIEASSSDPSSASASANPQELDSSVKSATAAGRTIMFGDIKVDTDRTTTPE
jgi:hypothetical protein